MRLFKIKAKEYVDQKQWHKWFAWYPIKTFDGSIVWLEIVWRKLYLDHEGNYKWYEYFAYKPGHGPALPWPGY